MGPGRTITQTGERRHARGAAKPFLTIVLQCDRPLQPGARFCLGDAEAVSVGRADTLSAKIGIGRAAHWHPRSARLVRASTAGMRAGRVSLRSTVSPGDRDLFSR